MFVLRNHFEGRTTILIHDRVINGCKDFSMNDDGVNKILKKYSVSDSCWKQVTDIYTSISTDEQVQSFITDWSSNVRAVIAKYGTDHHRDQLVTDICSVVRGVVALYGNDEHRKQLANDPNKWVRRAALR